MSPSATVAVFTVPVNCVSPTPSATKPKIPNDELEFVRSHCPPEST